MTGGYILLALLIGAIASFVSLGSDNEKWIKFALGAALAASLATAVFDTVKGFELPEDLIGGAPEYGSEMAEEALCSAFAEGIKAELCNDFSLSSEEVSVSVRGFSYENPRAESVRVVLRGGGIFADTRAIRAYVDENYGKCEVITEIE